MKDDVNNSNIRNLARMTAEILCVMGYNVKLLYGNGIVFTNYDNQKCSTFIDIDEKNNVFWINTPETIGWSRTTHLSYLPNMIQENLWITYPDNYL